MTLRFSDSRSESDLDNIPILAMFMTHTCSEWFEASKSQDQICVIDVLFERKHRGERVFHGCFVSNLNVDWVKLVCFKWFWKCSARSVSAKKNISQMVARKSGVGDWKGLVCNLILPSSPLKTSSLALVNKKPCDVTSLFFLSTF